MLYNYYGTHLAVVIGQRVYIFHSLNPDYCNSNNNNTLEMRKEQFSILIAFQKQFIKLRCDHHVSGMGQMIYYSYHIGWLSREMWQLKLFAY